MKKTTPSNCKETTCKSNSLAPGEGSQECFACEGNKPKFDCQIKFVYQANDHKEARKYTQELVDKLGIDPVHLEIYELKDPDNWVVVNDSEWMKTRRKIRGGDAMQQGHQLEFGFAEEWREGARRSAWLSSLRNSTSHLEHCLKYLPRPAALDSLIGPSVRLCYHLNNLCCTGCQLDCCDHTCNGRWTIKDSDGSDFITKICLMDGLKAGLITEDDINGIEYVDRSVLADRLRKWGKYEPGKRKVKL